MINSHITFTTLSGQSLAGYFESVLLHKQIVGHIVREDSGFFCFYMLDGSMLVKQHCSKSYDDVKCLITDQFTPITS